MPVHQKEKLTKTRSTGTSSVPNLCNKGHCFLACGIRQLYFFFNKSFLLSWWFYWWNKIKRFFNMRERAWHFPIISPSLILFSLLDSDLCSWLTWVWVNSGSWWWTERPGVLRFMGSQRVGHDWVTELNWTEPLRKAQIIAGEFPIISAHIFANRPERCGFLTSVLPVWQMTSW